MRRAGPPSTTEQHRSAISRFFELAWYVFPIVLIAVAHFISPLNKPVFVSAATGDWSLNLPPEIAAGVFGALLVQTVIAMIWIIGDFLSVSDMHTQVRSLKVNTTASIAVALIVAILSTWQLFASGHDLPWGYIVPLIAAILDAFLTGDRAINNAAQKPIFQQAAATA